MKSGLSFVLAFLFCASAFSKPPKLKSEFSMQVDENPLSIIVYGKLANQLHTEKVGLKFILDKASGVCVVKSKGGIVLDDNCKLFNMVMKKAR